jgi:hypothetical protein
MRKLGTFSALFLLAISLQWLGAMSNILTVKANNGKMPVLVISSYVTRIIERDDSHVVMTANSRYPLLCDLFYVPLFFSSHIGLEVVSLGDIGMDVGGYIFLVLPFVIPYWILKWLYLRVRKVCA